MRNPFGLATGGLSRGWRASAALLLALVIGSAGLTSMAQAADNASIGVWLQAEQVGARRTICVGDSVELRLTAWKRVGARMSDSMRRLAGLDIAASVVGSDGVGSISPASRATSLASNPISTTFFAFKAEKPGTAILSFTARVNQVVFLGLVVSGNTVKVQVRIQVQDCEFQVLATSTWAVPGEAGLTLMARIEFAGVALMPGESDRYRGEARVQWIVVAGQVGNCQGTLPPDSRAEVHIFPGRRDRITVDVSYDTATVPLVVDCGAAGGTRDVQITPDPLTFIVPRAGGQQKLSHLLRGPQDTDGRAFLVVRSTQDQ